MRLTLVRRRISRKQRRLGLGRTATAFTGTARRAARWCLFVVRAEGATDFWALPNRGGLRRPAAEKASPSQKPGGSQKQGKERRGPDFG